MVECYEKIQTHIFDDYGDYTRYSNVFPFCKCKEG